MGVGGEKFLPNEVTGVKVSDFCTELWKKQKKKPAWIAFELKKTVKKHESYCIVLFHWTQMSNTLNKQINHVGWFRHSLKIVKFNLKCLNFFFNEMSC